MPARLVYAPKSYVFTKNSAGQILNLTDYVTSGECQRLINQASTAEVTLRNPKRIFTIPANPAFTPMDAITIYLERIKGYPIQVFTGFLDDTPYYQMYPGTVTLQATCTLKRLMYMYFDPSLQYVQSFFQSYGWQQDGAGHLFNMDSLGNTKQVALNSSPNTDSTLQDGSIGKLLYATLTDIGQWDDTQIYIENLPAGSGGLGARIATLMSNLIAAEGTAATELTQFLDSTMGSSSHGSGAGSGSGSGHFGNAPKTPKGGYTKATWAAALLGMLGIAIGDANMQGLVGWENAEGGHWANNATYNPINTTQGEPGATSINSVGVKAYTTWAMGLQATQTTLTNGSYAGILAALKTGSAADIAAAIGSSPWGTGASLIAQTISNAPGNLGGTRVPGVSTSDQTNSATPGGVATVTVSADGTHSRVNSASQGTNAGVSRGQQTTVIGAIIEAANAINARQFPYTKGGHTTLGVPGDPGYDGETRGPGFDCSGSVSAVLGAAQLLSSPQVSGSMRSALGSSVVSGLDTSGNGVNIFANSDHVFMEINGRYWGTSDGHNGNPSMPGGSGAGWLPAAAGGGYLAGFDQFHIKQSILSQNCTYSLDFTGSASVASGKGGSNSNTSGTSMANTAFAEAFTAQINLPSIEDMSLAILLGQEGNGLMNDQQLLPFVQQLSQASMRSFQSLPNGDFYAFYPDYFGEFDQHPAYWNIDDLEVLTGDIYLNDSSLVTHQYVVGDNTYPADAGVYNELFSTGVITIYNAFMQGMGILSTADQPNDPTADKTGSTPKKTKATNLNSSNNAIDTGNRGSGGMADVMSQSEAIEFVKRYGARPQVSNYPQVRSSLFEMYLAYQQFMLSWANQFRTTFSFTFMPEVFPGGKISFQNHGIQMYVSSVTHSWDYSTGFTTSAVLTAPSQLPGTNNPDIPPNMVQALVAPVRKSGYTNSAPSNDAPGGQGKVATKQAGGNTAVGQGIASLGSRVPSL